ncbi:MAG: DUF4839 domain-containing protein [Nocardioidaceae bacterium]
MADDDVKYQYKSVQAIRGTEARSISKWQAQGWELVDQTPGKLRTNLRFRKPAPKAPWIPIAALLGLGVLILSIVGIVSLFQDDDQPASKPALQFQPEVIGSDSAAVAAEPEETTAASDDADEAITSKNDDTFAAVLAADSECANTIKKFAKENAGRTIEFDGSIADMANHGSF